MCTARCNSSRDRLPREGGSRPHRASREIEPGAPREREVARRPPWTLGNRFAYGAVDPERDPFYDPLVRRVIGVALVLGLLVSASGAALAARGDPQKRITRADQARAKAMLIRRSDLGAGFKAKPASNGHLYCGSDDESHLTLTGNAGSPDFRSTKRKYFVVGGGSEVYKSLAQAKLAWKQQTSPATVRCARNSFLRDARHAFRGELSASLVVHRVFFPRVARHTFAFEVVTDVSGPGGDVEIVEFLIALGYSRAIAFVGFVSAFRAPSLQYEIRLSRIVATRMQRAMRAA